MQNSLNSVFEGVPASQLEAYKVNFGIVYEMNGQLLSSATSFIVILLTIVVLAVLSIFIFKKQNK